MPFDDWRSRAHDVLFRIERIRGHLVGITKDQLGGNALLLDALERNLEVIGEAVRNIPDAVLDGRPDIPWAKVRGMRNVLAHHYWAVDHETLWETATQRLAPLEAAMLAILEAEPEEPE